MAIFPSPQTWLGSLGAAGPDVSNLDWITVNLLDGSWAASDPGGVIGASVNVASDIHTFNVNAVPSASADNNFSSTTSFTGPRWYAPLNAADGARINSDDVFTVSFEMVEFTPAVKDAIQLAIGFCEDPVSTTISNTSGILKTGVRLFYSGPTGDPRFSGMTTNSNTGAGVMSGQKVGLADITVAGRRMGAASLITLDVGLNRLYDATTNNNASFTGPKDLSLIVLLGLTTNTTTIAAPSDIKAKLRYRVVKWQPPPL